MQFSKHCLNFKWLMLMTLFFLLTGFFSTPAYTEDLRNLSFIEFDYYFNNTFRLTVEDVFLARFSPQFSLQLKAQRVDTEIRYEHLFSAGPVINFSENLYMGLLYGLKIDSSLSLKHRIEGSINYETDTSILSLDIRTEYFPDTGYLFILPSMGGKFQPLDWLAVFNKIFLSWDNNNFFSGSYWAELDWILNDSLVLRTGASISWAELFGYSIIVGCDYSFSETVHLRYIFKFMFDTVDYLITPDPKYGISNSILLDIKF